MFTSSLSSLVQSVSLTPRERREKLRSSVLIATLVASLGALSYGFVVGYASPVAQQLQKRFLWSDETSSWFDVSICHKFIPVAPGLCMTSYKSLLNPVYIDQYLVLTGHVT